MGKGTPNSVVEKRGRRGIAKCLVHLRMKLDFVKKNAIQIIHFQSESFEGSTILILCSSRGHSKSNKGHS